MQVNEIFKLIPEEQIKEVMNQDVIDIDYEFVGFIETYKSLSSLIPKHFTVIDFGCAYNPQCFYFAEHKSLISVDICPTTKVFKTDNCRVYNEGIVSFIENEFPKLKLNLNETFAISNYMPDGRANQLITDTFKNIYVFYPSHKENHPKPMKKILQEIIKNKEPK